MSDKTEAVSIKEFDFPPGADKEISAFDGGDRFRKLVGIINDNKTNQTLLKAKLKSEGFEDLLALPNFEEKLAFLTGWETKSFPSGGSPEAKKGGRLIMRLSEFPASLRVLGKDSNYQVISFITSFMYETLLGFDNEEMSYSSSLASHWKISDDNLTFWYRIDPNARWADGMPVVADDIIESWKIRVDKGIQQPSTNMTYNSYHEPKAISKYIVEVKVDSPSWKWFLYFSTTKVLPAHHLNKVTGKEFLEKYHFDMMPGTGPYTFVKDKLRKGKFITIARRSDYWAKDYESNIGVGNFDEIKIMIVKEDRIALEKFKKGELDVFIVSRAQWWYEDFLRRLNDPSFDNLNRGLIQMRKIFNYSPHGFSGIAMNFRREPFNNVNVRKAFSMLWDREKLIKTMFFDEYYPLATYFPVGDYQDKNNRPTKFNIGKALETLSDEGWNRNIEGWLEKDGKIFEIELGIDQSSERIFTVLQEDLKNAGIKLKIKNITHQTVFKNVMNDRKFDIYYGAWAGSFFPNPKYMWFSEYGRQPGTVNINGFENDRADEIIDGFDVMFDAKERVKAIRELDQILLENVPYALGWYAPYSTRFLYWNKFNHPDHYLGYSGDWQTISSYFWYDSDKADKLIRAKSDKTVAFEKPIVNVYYDENIEEMFEKEEK
jgi:microcin C transport system substrate-binding protein